MKNLQKRSLLILLYTMSSIYSSNLLPNSEFPSRQTNEYDYTISTIEKPMTDDTPYLDKPIAIWKTSKKNLYNDGITVILTSISTEKNMIVVTTEKWTTKNPSYFTSENAWSFFLTEVCLNSPVGNLIYGKNINIPLSQALLVAAINGTKILGYYLGQNETNVAQSVADTVKIEKTTLGSVVEQKNMISADELVSFINRNKKDWENIPVIKITAKLSKKDSKSLVTYYIKDQHPEKGSYETYFGSFIDDQVA